MSFLINSIDVGRYPKMEIRRFSTGIWPGGDLDHDSDGGRAEDETESTGSTSQNRAGHRGECPVARPVLD